MIDPRSLVPESVMPGYPFLSTTTLDASRIASDLKANAIVGVPYTEDMIKNAVQDALAQANPDDDNSEAVAKRYPKAQLRDFDGNPTQVTEMDAIIAYLQMLGTLVDFKSFKAEDNYR